jgi:ABC-2 type transport system permease protein
MTWHRTGATAHRVLQQLRHDRRTIALLLVVPAVLMGLLAWILSGLAFDHIGPGLLGIFPLIVMFLVTSVATLRERTSGTLERLMAMPLGKADFILGYALAFGGFALLQTFVVSGLSFTWYGLDVVGQPWQLVVVAVMDALLGTALGLFVSAFARSEFQAVQFMPALILPQLLLCGLVVPRETMPTVLQWVSDLLPLSYAVEATQQVMRHPAPTAEYWANLAVVAGFAVAALVLGAATLRRRTP